MPIPRRSFLKTVAASVVPAAALHDLIAQASPLSAPAELHVVGSGQDRYGEKHTLGFSSMSFKMGTSETAGNLFVIEHRNLMPGGGPPLHFHWSQEEWFYVMEGEVIFQVGDKQVQLKPGESILAPRRVPHSFSAVGQPSHMLIAFTPAGKMEQFFRDLQPNPALLMDAEFTSHYEMTLVGRSPFAKA